MQPPPYQSWGAGAMGPSAWQPYLSPNSSGYEGVGEHVAFADVDTKPGFAFLMNRMRDGERGRPVATALSQALG
jgi:hypothetical protein